MIIMGYPTDAHPRQFYVNLTKKNTGKNLYKESL